MKCLDGSNDIKVYNLTATKSLPDWLSKKKRKKDSKKDEDELLQDFQMPDVSSCMKLSPDGRFLMVAGTYKPVLKCYELSELSVKFERGMDAEVIRIEMLANDYSKMAFLQDERFVEIHGQCGKVDRLRVPRFGRDLLYHSVSSDLFISTSGSDIYRLNLFQGRFLNSITTNSSGINRLQHNQPLNLILWGTDDGLVQYWDPRMRSTVATLNAAKHIAEYIQSNGGELKSRKDLQIASMLNGGTFTLGVGTNSGQIFMYDIRWNTPYLTKDHFVEAPVKQLHFHSSGNVFSMAPGIVKIWNKDNGEAVTSLEGESLFNDMQVVPGTGLAFFAAEHRKMKAYFIPSLGPAPAWCAHLDAMTEEMEEDETSTVASQFDDYTFVTMEDLIELGLKDLIGTNMLRAVMHGYYINTATYNKVKQMANPVKPQNVIKQKIKETIAQQNTIKLKPDQSETDINSSLLNKVQEEKTHLAPAVQDPRFAAMFKDSKFKIDDNVQENVIKYSNLSLRNTKKDGFKKRLEEIQKEEEEIKPTEQVPDDDSESSDADSLADDIGLNDSDQQSSSDSEDQEERERLSKMFRSRGMKRKLAK